MSDGNSDSVKPDSSNDAALPETEVKHSPAVDPAPEAPSNTPEPDNAPGSNHAPEPSKHILPNPALSASAEHENILREKHIGQVIDCIRNVVDGKKLTPAMLIRVVANCMMITAKMKLPGGVKKKVIVNGLERYIRTCPDLDEEEVQVLMTAVDVFVDDAINVVAAVRSGDIKVKSCCVIA